MPRRRRRTWDGLIVAVYPAIPTRQALDPDGPALLGSELPSQRDLSTSLAPALAASLTAPSAELMADLAANL